MSHFLLTQQGPDHATRSLISPLVRVADRSENYGVNFHHWPVHRHLGKGGLMTGSSKNIYRHLEAGGRTAANEYDANYDYSQVTDTFDDEKES